MTVHTHQFADYIATLVYSADEHPILTVFDRISMELVVVREYTYNMPPKFAAATDEQLNEFIVTVTDAEVASKQYAERAERQRIIRAYELEESLIADFGPRYEHENCGADTYLGSHSLLNPNGTATRYDVYLCSEYQVIGRYGDVPNEYTFGFSGTPLHNYAVEQVKKLGLDNQL